MKTVLRNLLAVVAGLLVGGVVNLLIVKLGHATIPPPTIDPAAAGNPAAGTSLLEARHLLFPFLAHALGTLAGALAAYLLAGSRPQVFAYLIGVAFLVGGITAATMIPAPGWFIAADLVLAYLPMGWLATRLGARLRPVGGAGA
jgi:hypothetical protein